MDVSPKNFFLGIIDFFSIILPGALLSYFLRDVASERVLPTPLHQMSPTEQWIVFAVSSYLLGHFIFLLGSWLDELYDLLRKHTLRPRIRRLARTGKLMPRFPRALLWLVFKRDQDLALDRAKRIKDHYLKPLDGSSAVNTFQWAKARLTLEKPEALAVVQRFEADSKFFRSLVAVLILLPFLAGWVWDLPFTFVYLSLLILALWRFMEQRSKAINQAYWFILTMEGKDTAVYLHKLKVNAPTHAGGVVCRGKAPNLQYLLVEASDDSGKWVLPKGHIELNENAREAAVREVREETGVWAAIEGEPMDLKYSTSKESVWARFYPMRCLEEGSPSDTLREIRWVEIKDAETMDVHEDSKDLLRKVHALHH